MHLMVYAPYGRTGIYMLQEFCRRVGVHATDEGIRDLIAALTALPYRHPLGNLLREAPDFRQEAALADALLHPQDRAYSVPQLFDFLERGGLAFGRWLMQAPYMPRCGVMAKIPQASRMAQLSLAEQYAAVELFRGTMIRHSAVAYRGDRPGGPQRVSFDGDAWLDYVPIRVADTISCSGAVASRCGNGADQPHPHLHRHLPAARCYNRKKCSTPSTARARSARSSVSTGNVTAARAFFEQLWWYDQVVFDASNSRKQETLDATGENQPQQRRHRPHE